MEQAISGRTHIRHFISFSLTISIDVSPNGMALCLLRLLPDLVA